MLGNVLVWYLVSTWFVPIRYSVGTSSYSDHEARKHDIIVPHTVRIQYRTYRYRSGIACRGITEFGGVQLYSERYYYR